jgi:hypothetical protein
MTRQPLALISCLTFPAMFLCACSGTPDGSQAGPNSSPPQPMEPPIVILSGTATLLPENYPLPKGPPPALPGPPANAESGGPLSSPQAPTTGSTRPKPMLLTLTFTNRSEKEVAIDSVDVTNVVGSAYSLKGGCRGAVLRAKQANNCVVEILFRPPVSGTYEATLRLQSPAKNTVTTERLQRTA